MLLPRTFEKDQEGSRTIKQRRDKSMLRPSHAHKPTTEKRNRRCGALYTSLEARIDPAGV